MAAFQSVGLLRNDYFKSAPTLHLTYYAMFETLFFYSLWQIFYVYQMSFFLQHCVVFLLFCVAIVISEPFSARAYFRPDFAAIGREKFAAR